MSFQLKLLVLREADELNRHTGAFPHSVLWVAQDYGIIGQMFDLSSYRGEDREDIPEKPHIKTRPLPPGRVWVDDRGPVHSDPYGNDLVWAYVEDLKKLNIPESAHLINKALKAYLDALPDDTPIVLYLS